MSNFDELSFAEFRRSDGAAYTCKRCHNRHVIAAADRECPSCGSPIDWAASRDLDILRAATTAAVDEGATL
jgi:uncharacterized paraquat-inducible protein A